MDIAYSAITDDLFMYLRWKMKKVDFLCTHVLLDRILFHAREERTKKRTYLAKVDNATQSAPDHHTALIVAN